MRRIERLKRAFVFLDFLRYGDLRNKKQLTTTMLPLFEIFKFLIVSCNAHLDPYLNVTLHTLEHRP